MTRWLKWLIVVALLLGMGWVFHRVFIDRSWRVALERDRGVRVLAEAESLDELREAVGWLGVVLILPDRNWVAIYYKDNHAGVMWSQAVALDSGGGWHECQTHFCGTLQYFATQPEEVRKRQEEERERRPERWPPGPDENFTSYYFHLLAIQEAKDLATARGHLEAMGFQPLDVEEAPRLRGPLPAR